MTAPGCERIALTDLAEYAAGELPDAEADAIELHLFSCADCGARAAQLDALVRAIGPAVRSVPAPVESGQRFRLKVDTRSD